MEEERQFAIPVGEVKIGFRHRSEMGNLNQLARSMETIGLLHPIVVTPECELIAGQRRLLAARQLGWVTIPAHVVDLDDLLSAERDENIVRKDFTPTEMVAIGDAIREREEKLARERKGTRTDLQPPGNFPGGSNGRARDVVGRAVGVSGRTYDTARQVVEAAKADPERFGDLPALMDSSSVTAAYNELKRRQPPEAKRGETTKRKRGKVKSGNILPHGKSEREIAKINEHAERQIRASHAYDILEKLGRRPYTPQEVVAAIPPNQRHRIDAYLEAAFEWLEEFRKTWSNNNDPA